MIFGINTTSDISNLLYVISGAFVWVKFKRILKYHEWYLCQISHTNHAIIYLYYYRYLQKACNFHMYSCRYFKSSWNTTALSQSNCRNFSCSTVKPVYNSPVLTGQFSKSQFFAHTNAVFVTCIRRPPLLSGCGHPVSVPCLSFFVIFTGIKRLPLNGN